MEPSFFFYSVCSASLHYPADDLQADHSPRMEMSGLPGARLCQMNVMES